MATALQDLEAKLNEMLVDKAPVQLPDNWRKWIATYAWVFALIGLVFGVIGFFSLLALLGVVSVFGVVVGAGGYVFMAWVSMLFMAAYLVVLGIAIPKLKKMDKSGWDLLFYSILAFFVYDVFRDLRYANYSTFMAIIWTIAGTVLSLYVIFQVRQYFKSTSSIKPNGSSVKKSAK